MKKAQVTLFVIIAMIVLLGIVIGVSFFKSFNNSFTSEEFSLIQDNFQSCYDNSLKESLKFVAKNGGYAVFNEEDYEKNFIDKGIYFEKSFYPYYNFLDDNCDSNSECLKSYFPNFDFVVKQITYITNLKTEECLKNALEEYNKNSSQKISYNNFNVDSKIVFNDEKVKYTATLKGDFKKNSVTKNVFKISDSFNTDFKKLYGIVKAFSSFEYKTGFLEYYILDIISLNSGVDKKYPPFYSISFSYNTDFWNSYTVSSLLKEDVKKYFSLLRFSSEEDYYNLEDNNVPLFLKKYFVTLKDDNDDFLGDNAFLQFVSVPYSKVYFSNQPYISGEKISMPVEFLSNIIPIRIYSTKYDVEMPLLFSVRSKNSDLFFNFAFESNIKHNSPVKSISSFNNKINDINIEDKNIIAFEKIKNSNFYCSKPLGNKVKFKFYDENNNVLNDIVVNFNCNVESCNYNVDSNNAIFLPQCYNAKISFLDKNKIFDFDVIENYKSLDNSFYDEFNIVGYKKHKLNLKINIYDLIKVTEREVEENKLFKDKNRLLSLKPDHYELSTNKRSLEDNENLILIFKKLNSDFFYTIKINNSNYEDYKNIYLYPGSYSLDIILLKNLSSPFYIPEREECVFGSPDFVCVGRQKYDKVEFKDSFIEFSYSFNESNPFILDYNIIKNDDKTLEFNIPAFVLFKIPESERFLEDLSFMNYGNEIFLTDNNLGVRVK